MEQRKSTLLLCSVYTSQAKYIRYSLCASLKCLLLFFVQVYLRDGASQRHRRAVGDLGIDHQRVRAAAEGGTQTILT